MYTLLLVDDEEEVIEAIVKKVKWEELGFQVTGHANNGFKAMDMLEEMQPDVVMTCLLYTSPSPRDISGSRMPSSA